MERKFQIKNDDGIIVCDNMMLQVATNIYGFLCEVYHKDIFTLSPMPFAENEEEKIEKVPADIVEEN